MIAICEMSDQSSGIQFVKVIPTTLQAAKDFEDYSEEKMGMIGFQVYFYESNLSQNEVDLMSEQQIYNFMRENESKELDFQVIPKDGGAELNFKPDIVLVDLPANDSISNFSQSSLIVAPVRPSQLDMASLNKAIEESELEMSILPVFNAWMQNREEHNKFIEDYSDWPKIKNRNVFEGISSST